MVFARVNIEFKIQHPEEEGRFHYSQFKKKLECINLEIIRGPALIHKKKIKGKKKRNRLKKDSNIGNNIQTRR